MKLLPTNLTNLVTLEQLLQWHKVCELGGDKLHRPPVVALRVLPGYQDSNDLSVVCKINL